MTTVADQFAGMLVAKAKWIYGIGGDSLNGLTASVRRRGKIEWLHVCDEKVTAEIGMGAPESTAGAEYYVCGSTKQRMAGDLT